MDELKAISQINFILVKNIRKFTSKSSTPVNFQNLLCNEDCLELLNKPWFWLDLIRLHIINYSENVKLFSLNNFNPSNIPQTLIIAIYYSEYYYSEEKPAKLTEYMNLLFDFNFKKIIYKPSLSNLKALYIYMNEYFGSDRVSLSKACLSHMVRISYALGVHIDTNRFPSGLSFERKNLFREVSFFDLAFSGSFKLKPGYIFEMRGYDSNLYQVKRYLIPPELLNYNFKEFRLSMLKATLANFKRGYDNKTIELISFDFVATTNDQKIETCLSKISSLEISYKDS